MRQHGYPLLRVKDFNAPTTVFWQANTANARGQVTDETLGSGPLGNGLRTTKSFDLVTGWLDFIRTGPGPGASIQNRSYLFDRVGNLTQRQDGNQFLTENPHYDDLHRLDYTMLNGSLDLDLSYDSYGNILSMSTKIVIAQLDRLLKPLGFVREKATWNRRVDSLVDVVDIQVSKAGDAVTVNAGVLDTDVHRTLWGSEPPEFIEQPSCTVCARIHELIDDRDKWWQLSDHGTAAEMAEKVAAHVLPFLERIQTREAMGQWLIDTEVTKKKYPPPIINLAILKSLQGNVAQGCELLAELQKKSLGAWQTRAAAVAARLRCT